MTAWRSLFDRGADYEVGVDAVREALADHRSDNDGGGDGSDE